MLLVYLDHDLGLHRPEHLTIPYESGRVLDDGSCTEIRVVTRSSDAEVALPANFSTVFCNGHRKLLTKIFMLSRLLKLWSKYPKANLIIHNDPMVACLLLVLNLIALRKESRLIFRVTHLIEESKLESETRFFVRLAARIRIFFRKFAVRYCSKTFVTSRAMQAYFSTKDPRADIVVLPATIDFSKYVDDSNLHKDLPEGKVKIFLYVGTASDQRGFEEIFDFFHRNELFNCKFKVIFASRPTDTVCSILSNVVALGIEVEQHVGVAEEVITQVMSGADFGFANYPSTNPCYFNSPIKILQYYAMGIIPVISQNPHCMELALEVGSFRWLTPEVPGVFDECVISDRQLITSKIETLRQAYDASYVYSGYIRDAIL
ncbi:MAG: hypothetical protein COA96_17190 [SAR86 cluster bacterium]|uniref:Glycosyltransferase subfamily 4-like N-terminal domain-containing protein n=1 Tax=SAR86 cluster bacterium TaxID=2030880 RepID=A0A2A5AFU2_9GAMM|nr:MAG: hypothetical protein COA96_17190 [SAR86 cluster bacterium]